MFRSFLLFLLPCLGASAASITYTSIPERVRSSHPALHAARLAIDEARGRQLGAGRLSNPEAGLEFRHDDRFREGNLSFSFDQRFPITARLKLEKQLTTKLVQAAELEVQEMERKLVAEAKTAAIKLLAQQRKIELTRQQLSLMKSVTDFVKTRVEAGEISALDEAQLKLESQRLVLEERRLETETVQLTGEFRAAMGTDVELIGSLPPLSAVPADAAWESRADYRLAKLKEAVAQTDLELARSKKWEDVGAGVFAEGEREEDGGSLGNTPFFGFRISVPLPFWNKNEGEVAEKSASVNRSALETKALASSIRNQVRAARDEMRAAALLEKDARDKLLPLALEQTAQLEKAYESGQADLITVQRAREQRLQAESIMLDAVRDFHLARIRYDMAIGQGTTGSATTK